MIRILDLFIISILFITCKQEYLFDVEKKMENGIWTYQDQKGFQFSIEDTTALYNLYLTLSAADSFATENLYVKLWTDFPDGKRLEYLKSISVFDNSGKMIGKKSGHTATQQFLLQEKAFFNQIGNHQITIEQFMRADSIHGVSSVGLIIEKSKEKRSR
jgi:gliding motility-associated lipoprotein GldH